MYRPLAGALAVGQTLAADFDVGTIFSTFSVAVKFEGTRRAAVAAIMRMAHSHHTMAATTFSLTTFQLRPSRARLALL